MKFRSLFSGENKGKYLTDLSSAKFAQEVVKVKQTQCPARPLIVTAIFSFKDTEALQHDLYKTCIKWLVKRENLHIMNEWPHTVFTTV